MELVNLKGIGEKRVKLLNENGINTLADLVEFLPASYKDLRVDSAYADCDDGVHALIKAEVISPPTTNVIRQGFSIVSAKCRDKEGSVFYAQWFNQPYIKMRIKQGKKYLLFGVVSHKAGKKIINPVVDDAVLPKKLKGVMPVYRKIEGVPPALLRDLTEQALEYYSEQSFIPESVKSRFGIFDLKNAYRALHNPVDFEQIERANRSVGLTELVKIMFAYKCHKQLSYGTRSNHYKDNRAKLNELIATLPYMLTDSQNAALADILADLVKPVSMNRMLAGDVGSGKTIVAVLALYNAVLSGYQAALMAPTEVLAHQHYRTVIKLLAPLGVRVKYYTGSLSKGDRDSILFDIRNGNADIIIGTHALIQDNVKYSNLALVITDELHRFGVAQRNKLENKGDTDVLVMSATPLPRTLALVFYSDLDVSYLKYPKTRAEKTVTKFVPAEKVEDMFGYIRELAQSNKQSYIVCPRIEENDEGSVSACGLYKKLANGVFHDISIGLLHGRLSEEEKKFTVARFNNGEIKVLVSTTVVEVGIDVKDAVVMAVFGAERYGLSQLHQLRGRVGRGSERGFCFLITDTKNQTSIERLSILKSCNDGFELSDYDLAMRGAGDLLGVRQSGAGDLFFRLTLNRALVDDAAKILEMVESNPSALEELKKQSGEKYPHLNQRVALN